jgi:predicted transcriptional regulator
MNADSTTRAGTAVLTVRLPVKLKRRLEALARSRSSNRSRLAVQAIQTYVDEREAQLAKIDQGIRDADAGRVVPHAKVKRYLQSWGTKRRLAPPVCE